jgi:hypothetical protein
MDVRLRNDQSEAEARRVIEAYFPLFNKRDASGPLEVVNFPHIRIAQGSVTVIESPEEWTGDPTPLDPKEGWHRSALDSLEFIQSSHDKVHAIVVFSRHKADGSRYVTYPTLWIVTRQNGHWGIQIRSTFAP